MKAEDITEELLIGLRRIVRVIDLHSRRLVQKYGLTGPQLFVLKTIEGAKEGVSVGEIAVKVSLSSATVTDILSRLEKRGLVTRLRSTVDKRKVLVRMTGAGEELLVAAPPLLRERFIEKVSELEPWEKMFLISALQRLVAMMEAEDMDAPGAMTEGFMEALPDPAPAAQLLEAGLAGSVPDVAENVNPPKRGVATE